MEISRRDLLKSTALLPVINNLNFKLTDEKDYEVVHFTFSYPVPVIIKDGPDTYYKRSFVDFLYAVESNKIIYNYDQIIVNLPQPIALPNNNGKYQFDPQWQISLFSIIRYLENVDVANYLQFHNAYDRGLLCCGKTYANLVEYQYSINPSIILSSDGRQIKIRHTSTDKVARLTKTKERGILNQKDVNGYKFYLYDINKMQTCNFIKND